MLIPSRGRGRPPLAPGSWPRRGPAALSPAKNIRRSREAWRQAPTRPGSRDRPGLEPREHLDPVLLGKPRTARNLHGQPTSSLCEPGAAPFKPGTEDKHRGDDEKDRDDQPL